jgi:hypothetical protein
MAQDVPAATDGSLKISWNEVTKNQDGSDCKNLAGYKIYIGEAEGEYTRVETVGTVTSTEVGNLEVGKTYYVALTAYNTYANESGKSVEVSSPGIFYKIPEDVNGVIIIKITIKLKS